MPVAIKIELTEEQKQLFKETAGRPDNAAANQARQEFAAQFGDMVLKTLPIGNTVRDIYEVRTKTTGEMKFMVEPNDTVAWHMSKIGQFARNYIEGDVVFINTEVYQTSVYYSLDFAKDADYNVASIAMNKMNEAMQRLEESEGWLLIRAAVNNAPSSQKVQVANGNPGAGYFSKQLLNTMLLYFEIEGKALDAIYLPPTAMADVRNWTETNIDPETQRQIFVAGGLSGIWNIKLIPVPLIRYYETIDDRKARRKTIIDRLFNPNDKLLNGSDVWNSGAKTAYANGTLEVCYGISKQDFGILAIKEEFNTYIDPTAITRYEQGIMGRQRSGFAIIDSERIVMGVVDRTYTES